MGSEMCIRDSNWTFADEGYRLESLPVTGKYKYSPFSVPEIMPGKRTLLVDFDNLKKTPTGVRQRGAQGRSNGCHYKYELPIIVSNTDSTGRQWETKIIIDPIIGNNGGPPGGNN